MMILTVVLLFPSPRMFPLGHVAVQQWQEHPRWPSFLARQQVKQNYVASAFPTSTLLTYVTEPLITTHSVILDGCSIRHHLQLWTVETRRWVQNGTTTTECYVADATVTVSFPQGVPLVYSTRLFADAHAMQEQWMRTVEAVTIVEVLRVAMVVTLLLLTGILGFAVSGASTVAPGSRQGGRGRSRPWWPSMLPSTITCGALDVNSVYLNPSGVTAGLSFLSGTQ